MRARYGASPVHLLAHLVLLPVCAWALLTVFSFRAAENVALWLIGAAVLHDLLLLPAYGLLDQLGQRVVPGAINYVRVPAGLSLLLLLVFFSTISGRGSGNFHFVTGHFFSGYLNRWLLATAVLFGASLALYVFKSRRSSP